MDLSIIIVNYNVKHFLEQCLCSVQKAIAIPGIQAEVLIIDNNSSDNSIDYLQPGFPFARFIHNTENVGFARACNQALALAGGRYILFLNPDTIVPEDCFSKCIAFFESHADAGAIGIRMVDGRGKFLKESKRAFPDPFTSLYKLSGLSKLFPHSHTFGKYHLEYLSEKENHEIDVLAGAFIMIKRGVLEKTGSFDETFFMYGEDIDLSYRIQEAGFKNYYFAESSIIHFKGESTRKVSLNYIRMFYSAMATFVRKHYGSAKAGFFNFLIHIAIWVRAFFSATGRFIEKLGLPLIDAGLILFSFVIAKIAWNGIRPEIQYVDRMLLIAFPFFTFMYLLAAYYAGLYDRKYKRPRLVRSTLVATITLLAAYSLLPEKYRFSRAIVLIGALLSFVLISLLRVLLIRWKVLHDSNTGDIHPKTLIAASPAEYEKTLHLMNEAGLQERVIGRIAVHDDDKTAVGNWKNIRQLSTDLAFSEIIFCEGSLSFKNIIDVLQQIPENITAKFHAGGSNSIVGSDSKDEGGETLTRENGFKLSDPYNRRLKRLVDILFSFFAIATFPVQLFLVKKPFGFLANSIAVLFARKTWIGYAVEEKYLPPLRHAVIASNGLSMNGKQQWPEENLRMSDEWYARDYEPGNDLKLLWKVYRHSGG
jgi:GT2 family glycosyltransferase